MENVVKFPDELERIAQKIEDDLDRKDDAHTRGEKAGIDWRDAALNLAVDLFEGKKALGFNDKKFGDWCKGRFGDNRLNSDDRAALVRWGEDPEGTRAMLANTNSMSVQHIDRRFRQVTKPQQDVVGGDKSRAVQAALQENEAKSLGLNQQQIADAVGVSVKLVRENVRLREAAERVGVITYTKGQEYHIEARIRTEVKARTLELEREFETRVITKNQEEIKRLLPDLEKVRESAKRSEKYHREQLEKNAVFTEIEFLNILRSCHPDNSASQDVRQRAFIAVRDKKFQLTGIL